MPESRLIETLIAGEECGIPLLAQQNNDLLVLQAFMAEVDSDLPRRNPPRLEQQLLSVEDVLVENDQARARASTYSGAVYSAE